MYSFVDRISLDYIHFRTVFSLVSLLRRLVSPWGLFSQQFAYATDDPAPPTASAMQRKQKDPSIGDGPKW